MSIAAKAGCQETDADRVDAARSVFPDGDENGIFPNASDLSAKSTGKIPNVDAGNVLAFTR